MNHTVWLILYESYEEWFETPYLILILVFTKFSASNVIATCHRITWPDCFLNPFFWNQIHGKIPVILLYFQRSCMVHKLWSSLESQNLRTNRPYPEPDWSITNSKSVSDLEHWSIISLISRSKVSSQYIWMKFVNFSRSFSCSRWGFSWKSFYRQSFRISELVSNLKILSWGTFWKWIFL